MAVADIERLAGESDFEFRMRQICHLHLTRFVCILLNRKDRMSMATGLEVRRQTDGPVVAPALQCGHEHQHLACDDEQVQRGRPRPQTGR